jgi:hypothetical protein
MFSGENRSLLLKCVPIFITLYSDPGSLSLQEEAAWEIQHLQMLSYAMDFPARACGSNRVSGNAVQFQQNMESINSQLS